MTSAVNIVELGNDNSSNLDGRVVHLGLLRSWNSRSWWCRAVLADEAFLDDLTRENCGLLIQQDFQNATYYPSGQITSASVLTFVDENSAAGDSFLQMLQNTYRNTRRKDVSDLRFTVLFLVSSTAPCVLEFPNEKSYWDTRDQTVNRSRNGSGLHRKMQDSIYPTRHYWFCNYIIGDNCTSKL